MSAPRWQWILVILAAVVMVASLWQFHAELIAERMLMVNDNTLRDFEVYGRVRRGMVPLQGPVTSVGGNHGWMGPVVFGLAVTVWPSLDALYATSLGAVVLGALVSTALAWRLAPGLPALLGGSVMLGTHMTLLTYFPSHIALILVGTPMAFLGATLAREHRWGASLAVLGIVIAMGGHRSGWALLITFLIAEWAFTLRVFRRPESWGILGLYLLPKVIVAGLGGSPTPGDPAALARWLASFDPWLVLRLMPFVQLPIRPFDALQAAQMSLVAATLLLGWRVDAGPVARLMKVFYVVTSVAVLFVNYDGQYYMPMLSLLPALIALAWSGAWSFRPALASVWTLAVLAVASASHADVRWASFTGRNLSDLNFQSVAHTEQLVAALGRHGITRDELWHRVDYTPDVANRPPLAYLAVATLPMQPGDGNSDRCFHVRAPHEVEDASAWERIGGAYVLKVDAGGPCVGTLTSFDSPIWYVDLALGGFHSR